jgi:LysR family nitrogen assimilation transcriptional regulator
MMGCQSRTSPALSLDVCLTKQICSIFHATRFPNVDYAKLKLFIQVAELGSLTKAAVMLDTAQSAISRQISALERDWGGRLFHRTGRGVALTELGKRVLPRAKALLLESDQLLDDIKASAGIPTGEVRVAILPSISVPIVNRLYRATRERYPGIRLHILEGSTGQVDEWLVNGRVEVAMLYRYGKGAVTNEYSLATVDTYLVGPANDPITRSPTVRFEKLDRLPLILPGVPNALRVLLDQMAKKKRISLSIAMEADSIPLQKEVTAECGCHTLLPIHAVLPEVQTGRLQASKLVNPGIERTIALGTTTQRPLTGAGREMAKLIRQIVADLSGTGAWQQLRR